MALHFLHIGKTGGSAVKQALAGGDFHRCQIASKYGPVVLHGHRTRATDVPSCDAMFFIFRDPIDRFLSGFHSRKRKGSPRYSIDWSAAERRTFQKYPTVASLLDDLSVSSKRQDALEGINSISHLRRDLSFWVDREELFRVSDSRIAWIGRTETLSQDWERAGAILGLHPFSDLPVDDHGAHRAPVPVERLSESHRTLLRQHLSLDYQIVELLDGMRLSHGWASGTFSST